MCLDGANHTEWWIPCEDLEALNANIVSMLQNLKQRNKVQVMDTLTLAKYYDENCGVICNTAQKPSQDSILKIEQHFNITLPKSLIAFAQASQHYGNWLASLGDDYDSYTHIIRVNSYLRRCRKSRRIPSNLIAFTVGYDEDYECFDLETYDSNTNEYKILYWSPDVDNTDIVLYENFNHYMSSLLTLWQN